MHDSRAWALAPYDVGSVCAYYAGLLDLSREWLAKALELAPDDPRISRQPQVHLSGGSAAEDRRVTAGLPC